MEMDSSSVSIMITPLVLRISNASVWATDKMRENLVKFGDRGVIADDSHHVTKYNMKLSTYVVSL